jgi:hypothetical protein
MPADPMLPAKSATKSLVRKMFLSKIERYLKDNNYKNRNSSIINQFKYFKIT